LSILICQLNAKLDESVAFVQAHDQAGLFAEYQKIAGKIMASFYFDIQRVLWEQYPDLKPVQMGGEYRLAASLFEPHFYRAPSAPSPAA